MVKASRHFVVMALAFALSASPLSAVTRTRARTTLDAVAIVDAMNVERAQQGLAPLRLNTRLSLAAVDRLRDMFAKHYFDHVSPDGIDPFSWFDKRGYHYTEAGENLAVGYGTPSGIVDGWMHSAAHRENVLKAHFDEVGIAITSGSPRRPFSGPTVVALYGSRK